jgi:hypothetical protein
MKDYLKRYQSGPAAADQKKAKKKKKTKPNAPAGAGVLIVDEDPVWQKPVQIEEDEPASSGLNLRNPSRSCSLISLFLSDSRSMIRFGRLVATCR